MRQFFILLAVFFFSTTSGFCSPSGVVYPFRPDPIDVVIPSTHKDLATLELCIKGIKQNCQVRRVIVVSSEKLTDNAEWFDETAFPFSKSDVALQLHNNQEKNAAQYYLYSKSRLGWYYQQLLKFYAPFVIPGISSNVLILDSDTIFLNPVKFLNSSYAGLYNTGSDLRPSYFNHADRLTDGAVKRLYQNYSGVSHHMLFQKCVLEDLFALVETIHNKEFWKAFCNCVDPTEVNSSGASEYEIYFNFVLSRTKQVEIRKLMWKDVPTLEGMIKYKLRGYHYVSCHDWNRN